MSNPCLDAAIKELMMAGVTEYRVVNGGKHLQLKWETKNGKRTYNMAQTPSDWRAAKNVRGEIRRLLRYDGIVVAEPLEEEPPRLSVEQRVTRLEEQLKNVQQMIEQYMIAAKSRAEI